MKLFVFGSTGDLVKRKVVPALQNLGKDDLEIFALGRQDITKNDYTEKVCSEDRCTVDFREKIKYRKLDFEKEDICDGVCINLFDKNKINYVYISLPPNLIEKVLSSIVNLRNYGFDMKILIEKPFGDNSSTAKKLKFFIENNNLSNDIFLSDHYLFKKLDFKADFQNIKIVSHENIGLEGRAGYYDSIGALKDMVQSHFMNIVFSRLYSVVDEFNDFEVIDFKRGQYNGYKEELGMHSDTETFVYLKFKTKTKVFEFITGKSFREKELYVEVDGNRFDIDSSGDYERLFKDFFEHNSRNFANLDNSVFSWEFIESLTENSTELFYYDKGSSFDDLEHNLIN